MTTKIKHHTIVETLKIIETVEDGESKASLFRERGIPEGTICGWMREENKLHSFVDSTEDEVGRKETRLCEHSEIDECLCKWFL
jgi:hypothetical protein